MKRLCIHWPRFGPYHLARLEAAQAYLAPKGVEVVGLETASLDTTYAWRAEERPVSFRRVQVFPGRVFDDVPPAEMHAGVVAALDRLQPDAVLISSYSFPDARACLWWCRRHHRTAVVVTDTKEDDAARSPWRERIKSVLVRQFDAAFLSGTPHRAYFEKLGFPPDRIFLGCSVVDNTYFEQAAGQARSKPEAYRHLPGLENATPFFLCSSRFIQRKNLDGLLRAYHRYRQQIGTPWRLVLLGDGPERATLEAFIEREHVQGVTLAGFRQIEDLPAYYGLAGAYVHPARAEQWGLVVNEAMAAGLPVLVSERTGCAYDLVVDGENGYRFDPDAPDQLAELMVHMTHPEADLETMGRRSREIIAQWSLERYAAQVWAAACAGRDHAARAFGPAGRLLLWMLRQAARDTRAFHTVEA